MRASSFLVKASVATLLLPSLDTTIAPLTEVALLFCSDFDSYPHCVIVPGKLSLGTQPAYCSFSLCLTHSLYSESGKTGEPLKQSTLSELTLIASQPVGPDQVQNLLSNILKKKTTNLSAHQR